MSGSLTYEGTLTILVCWCGLRHAVPDELRREQLRSGMALYCPLGHPHIPSTMSETTRLKKQVAELEESRNRLRARANEEYEARQATERRLSATKGVLTRERKRIHNGVCPVCRRSFKGLAEHMHKQHPDYVEASSE